MPKADLEAQRQQRLASRKSPHVLPKALHQFEYRFSRIYLKKIKSIATANNAALDYVYLPGYKAPGELPAYLYNALNIDTVPLQAGSTIRANAALWFDATHVNANGATMQTQTFTQSLIAKQPALGQPSSCKAELTKRED